MAGSDDRRLIPVHTLADQFEADVLKSALEGESIPAVFRSFVETAYSGLFVDQKGWGLILVPEDMAEAAGEVIRSALREAETAVLYSDPLEIDPSLWEALRHADPSIIRENAGVDYDFDRTAFEFRFLGSKLLCYPEEESIEIVDPAPWHKIDFELTLAVLHYLLESRSRTISERWVGAKDIPGGEAFFRGPHQFPVDSILSALNNRPERFAAAMERLGGRRSDIGDVSFIVDVLPRVPMMFVLWEGDEEFSPAMNILFNEAVSDLFPRLDALWALVNVVCGSVRTAIDSINGHQEEGAIP